MGIVRSPVRKPLIRVHVRAVHYHARLRSYFVYRVADQAVERFLCHVRLAEHLPIGSARNVTDRGTLRALVRVAAPRGIGHYLRMDDQKPSGLKLRRSAVVALVHVGVAGRARRGPAVAVCCSSRVSHYLIGATFALVWPRGSCFGSVACPVTARNRGHITADRVRL